MFWILLRKEGMFLLGGKDKMNDLENSEEKGILGIE